MAAPMFSFFRPSVEPTFAPRRRPPHEPLPASLHFLPPSSADTHKPVRLFVEERRELVGALGSCRERLQPGAQVWVSWPQRASQVPTDISDGFVRDIALRLGFLVVKASGASEVWALMKLVMQPRRRDGVTGPHAGPLTLVEERPSDRRA